LPRSIASETLYPFIPSIRCCQSQTLPHLIEVETVKTQHCSSIWQIELRLNRQNLAISAGVEKSGLRIGHGLAIAQPGALDAEFDGLGVDALGSGALLVDVLVDIAFTTSW